MKKFLPILCAIVALASCSPEQKAYDQMHRSYLTKALYPGTVSFANEYLEYSTDSLFIIQVVVRELGDSAHYQRRELEYCYGIFEDERRELWTDLSNKLGIVDHANLLLINDGLEFPYTQDDAIQYVATTSLIFDGEKVR